MWSLNKTLLAGAFAASALFMGTAANAATVTLVLKPNASAPADLAAYKATQSPHSVSFTETFEGIKSFEDDGVGTTNPVTSVGTFTGSGTTGTGASSIKGGAGSEVRSAPNFGRDNTTPGGSHYLDSNDKQRLLWAVNVGRAVNSLAFYLTDAADQGARLTISAAGTVGIEVLSTSSIPISKKPNGNLYFVTVFFSAPATNVSVSFAPTRNDGIGIDDATVSAVPLPPAVLLLGTALGGLGFAGRRRKAAAAKA